MEECFCSRVSVRLEDAPDVLVRIILGRDKRRTDFGWVMGIVINNRKSIPLPFVLKTAYRSGKG